MLRKLRDLSGSEFIRNVFTLMSATTLAQILAILIYLVLARIYTTSEHGIFGIYMSIIAITGILSTGKYEVAIMMPTDDIRAYNLAILGSALCVFFSIILLILVALFHSVFALWLGDESIEKWLWFVPLSTLMIGWFQILSYWSNRNKRFGRMAAANAGQSLANSLVKVSTGKVFPAGGGLIAGAITGQFVGILLFARDFLRKKSVFQDKVSISLLKELAREYVYFPRFSMIHNLVNNLSASLPVFILASRFGTAEAGLYSFAFMMVFRPVNLVTNSFSLVFSQRVISNYNQRKEIFSDVRRLSIKLFQAGIIPFMVAGVAGPHIFSFLFGNTWAQAGAYMQILLPWIFVVLISSPLSFLPDMLKRQRKAMWLDILKIILRIPALFIGVYYDNIYLALVLFSLVSTLSVGYSLYWFFMLAKKADREMAEREMAKVELPVNPDVKVE